MRLSTYFVLVSLGILTAVFANPIQANGQISTPESQDSTPISAITSITNNTEGKLVFNPSKITIKEGQEIIVLNNLTTTHTFTNGKGSGDPMDGKIFSVDLKPHGFAEYLSNLSPGNYSFYSKNDPSIKGELIILP